MELQQLLPLELQAWVRAKGARSGLDVEEFLRLVAAKTFKGDSRLKKRRRAQFEPSNAPGAEASPVDLTAEILRMKQRDESQRRWWNDLNTEQILAWADSHFERTGKWPNTTAGKVVDAPKENWRAIDTALRVGVRGLNKGSSLARLLHDRRGLRNPKNPPPLTESLILSWADAHRARTGRWPTDGSGKIADAPDESWRDVSARLRLGGRGLPGGSSLPQLLVRERGKMLKCYEDLSTDIVAAWVDDYGRKFGKWPNTRSGMLDAPGAPKITWGAVDQYLGKGGRGLPGGSNLRKLCADLSASDNPAVPPITEERILAWADAHHERTGAWPNTATGTVVDAPKEHWKGLDSLLRQGGRGLAGGSSLAVLLNERRGLRNPMKLPPLTEDIILAWADAHFKRTGAWPNDASGKIEGAPGDAWAGVDAWLRLGGRGLPGGSSLARLLAERRGKRFNAKPDLRVEQILEWMESHHLQYGRWPTSQSGPITAPGAPNLTWGAVNQNLSKGGRGLPGGSNLKKLYMEQRGGPGWSKVSRTPRLTEEQIIGWARAHRARTGYWPNCGSGPVLDARDRKENWGAIQASLQMGYRGLPGGSSVSMLLKPLREETDAKPRLTESLILSWVDAHRARTGRWPTEGTGKIVDAPGESWAAVSGALRLGGRGLPGGSSLARLLLRERGKPLNSYGDLSIDLVSNWADAYGRKFGKWPDTRSGMLDAPGAPKITWGAVDQYLGKGGRGLPGGSSLKSLCAGLAASDNPAVPPITEERILAWADAHHERTGAWPNTNTGTVVDAPKEHWKGLDNLLRQGGRGLAGGSSLAVLLNKRRGLRNPMKLPPLTEDIILAWADAHFKRTGAWPNDASGKIEGAPGDAWAGVDAWLRLGGRSLPGGSSLARLLAERRGKRFNAKPDLRVEQILEWMESHHLQYGRWPTSQSGPITAPGAPNLTWGAVNQNLSKGGRGLPGGSNLKKLYMEQRGGPGWSKVSRTPRLTEEQIIGWARAHRARTGYWPNCGSGPVLDAGDRKESWGAIQASLQMGYRGLPGGSSVSMLLKPLRDADQTLDKT